MKTFDLLDIATLVSAVGCGLVAGVFFAFSTSVMKALGSLPPACGIAAMQTINVVIINPWFLVTFFATGAACLYVMIASFLQWPDARAPYGLVGGALYLVGTLLVTVVCNVPRNNTLAATVPSSQMPPRCGPPICRPGRRGTTCGRSPHWRRHWLSR